MRSCWLLAVGQLASKPLLVKTEIKASIPRHHAAGRPASGWLAPKENLLGTISPIRPAKTTGRRRVCAATEFLLLSTALVQFLAGQAVGRIRQYENSCRTGSPSPSWLFGGRRSTTPLPLPTISPSPRSIHWLSFTAAVQLGARLPFHPVSAAVCLVPFKHSHARVRVRCGMKSDFGKQFHVVVGCKTSPSPHSSKAHEDTRGPHSRPLMAARLRHGGGRNWVYSNRRRRGHDLEPHGTLALITDPSSSPPRALTSLALFPSPAIGCSPPTYHLESGTDNIAALVRDWLPGFVCPESPL